ncbi:MAG: diguanylate cyclase [Bacteroidetes bacterium]|nr:MAG: diguanylate cyclase [Bacteroidota bacterium]RLD74466.1 MAG: diguanylate cyclase [Bacteroidota bacterium]
MNLNTSYLGLELKNPLIASSSRLTGDLETIIQCVHSGIGAIVLKSLFEEQIRLEAESKASMGSASEYYYWFTEAKEKIVGLSLEERLSSYLKFVEAAKKYTDVPVISSINCTTAEDWPKFASAIEQAGADALELNIALFPFNASVNCGEIEQVYYDILNSVKKEVNIPVSIKLGYYFTNLCTVARNLVAGGADGLVLFNRYFRPDIDIDTMNVISENHMSSSDEMHIPLRWIGLLKGNDVDCDIAASTGVHDYKGVVKQLLAGADAVQLCSALYLKGIPYIETILRDLEHWMEKHHFDNIDSFRGKALNTQTVDASFERVQFLKRDFD